MVMGTTFMFLWDVKFDWGLLTGGFMDNKFLRDQILYSDEVSWQYFTNITIRGMLNVCLIVAMNNAGQK